MMNSIYRNKNKLGKTKKYLDLAKQCFESGYSIEDYSLYHELYGSYLDKFLGISPRPDERVKELALTSFKKMNEVGSQHSRQRVNDKKRFYALICSAMIQLDSNSSFGRKLRTVTEESIDLAAEWLGVIKRDFRTVYHVGPKFNSSWSKVICVIDKESLKMRLNCLRKVLLRQKSLDMKQKDQKSQR